MNTTSEVPGSSRSPSYVLLVFSQALAFLIIVGNSLVITTYRRNAFLFARTNIFIVSLVFSDLLVGAVYPCRYGLISRLLISRISRYICWRIICFFDIFSTLASISNFTAISIERCYVISRPFTYVNDSSVQNIYIYSMTGGSDHGGSLANANIDNAKKSIYSLRFHCQLRVTKYFDTGNVHKDLPNCKFAGS